ncbi:NAD(P)H-binding protein [Streptomyces sp. NPDC001222]|uniref:NAD(P)H-binding protein n=1 Tax=Streptomyces sp. NPDC001222 TaxID=3364548 RepID=UPI003693CCB5
MAILATGATGNVGRNVVRQLVEAGAEVRALTRSPRTAGFPEVVRVVAGDPRVIDRLVSSRPVFAAPVRRARPCSAQSTLTAPPPTAPP